MIMETMVRWSYSTVNSFRQCNRKYYFAQVMATHGRKIPERRKAYELKKMQNMAMWKGSVVDKFMEKTIIPAIRDKKELNFQLFADQAVELAKNQYRFSEAKAYTDAGLKKVKRIMSFVFWTFMNWGNHLQKPKSLKPIIL